MMRPKVRCRFLAVFVLLFALTSCKEPVEGFKFIPTSVLEQSAGSTFDFSANLAAECRYRTRIAVRLNSGVVSGSVLPLEILLVSPTGVKTIEQVDFPLSKTNSAVRSRRNSGKVEDYEWFYREHIDVSDDPGLWHISVRPGDESIMKGILGIGFAYELENGEGQTQKI